MADYADDADSAARARGPGWRFELTQCRLIYVLAARVSVRGRVNSAAVPSGRATATGVAGGRADAATTRPEPPTASTSFVGSQREVGPRASTIGTRPFRETALRERSHSQPG
jgi:hypothetical protein